MVVVMEFANIGSIYNNNYFFSKNVFVSAEINITESLLNLILEAVNEFVT